MRERKTIFCGVLGARTHACKVCLSVELIERGRAGFHMKPTFSHHPRIVKILLLHYTSLVTHEFVRRHPNFQIAVGSRFIVNKNHLSQWYGAVLDFVEVTDRYFFSRCVRDESKGKSSIRSGLKIA